MTAVAQYTPQAALSADIDAQYAQCAVVQSLHAQRGELKARLRSVREAGRDGGLNMGLYKTLQRQLRSIRSRLYYTQRAQSGSFRSARRLIHSKRRAAQLEEYLRLLRSLPPAQPVSLSKTAANKAAEIEAKLHLAAVN